AIARFQHGEPALAEHLADGQAKRLLVLDHEDSACRRDSIATLRGTELRSLSLYLRRLTGERQQNVELRLHTGCVCHSSNAGEAQSRPGKVSGVERIEAFGAQLAG